MKFTPLKVVVSSILVASIALTGFNSYTIVQPGEAKIGTFFGKVVDDPILEGFHIVNPLMNFDTYSTKDFTVNWNNIQVPAQDKLKSSMDLAVTLSVKTASLAKMKREAGTLKEAFDKYVSPRVYSLLRECGKGVEMSQDFFKDEVQTDMQSFMLSNLREQLEPLGFNVKVALFSDISLPPLVQTAIEATKKRQEEVNQETAKLAIVALEQQKVVKAADAKRDAASSNAAAKKIDADANAYAVLTEATAEADANTLLNRTLTPELIKYRAIEAWDGAQPKFVGGGVMPMINLEDVN